MDRSKRDKLIETITRQYGAGSGPPVVELDEFFDGNWDEKSIAPNQVGYGRPSLARCWEVLRSIRDRDDVDHVLVGILECPEADEPLDAEIWPSAENVHIYAKATSEEVFAWVAELKTDGVGEGWPYGIGASAPIPRPDYKVHTLCWD